MPDSEQTRWFASEVHPHEGRLRAYLQGAFPGLRDVDDVVQDAFLRIWRTATFQPIASAKAFLFTAARRLAIDRLRRSRRSPIVVVPDLERLSVTDGLSNAADATQRAEAVAVLVEAVESLPSRCREIFILRRLQGVPQREIAVRLGLSEQTVQVQAARGMRKCGEFVRRRLGDR